MNDINNLKPLLLKLRMSGILENLEPLIQRAMDEQWSYTQVLLHLFSTEVERRNHKQVCFKLARSGLDTQKTLETYDFGFNKSVTKALICELAECTFIERKENIFFVGPSGVGKTHLATALGNEACRKGYDVYYRRTSSLLDWIHSGNADGTVKKKIEYVNKVQLLILDDFGLLPVNEKYQEYLYEIITERYEKKATIITSNRDFVEWIDVFTNQLIGSAAMDRLVHRAVKVTIEGDSFRTVLFRKKQKELFGNEKG